MEKQKILKKELKKLKTKKSTPKPKNKIERKYIIIGVVGILLLIIFIPLIMLFSSQLPEQQEILQGDIEYKGTFTFDEEVGKIGNQISFCRYARSGTTAEDIFIKDDYYGHKSVLVVGDYYDDHQAYVAHYFDTEPIDGEGDMDFIGDSTIEFYISTSTPKNHLYFCIIQYEWEGIELLFKEKTIWYLVDRDNDVYVNLNFNIIGDVWYHIKINFYDTEPQDTYDLIINDVEMLKDQQVANNGNLNAINAIVITTSYTQKGYEYRFDAFGYSWDENYNIGDNKLPI